MKNKKEIIKAARRIFHFKDAVKNPKIMNPNRDWWIGLVIGLSILLVTAFWSATTYIENRSPGMNIDNSIVSDVVIYRASQVDTALEAYKLREQKHTQLLKDNYFVTPEPIVEEEIEAETEMDIENSQSSLNEDTSTPVEDLNSIDSADDEVVLND